MDDLLRSKFLILAYIFESFVLDGFLVLKVRAGAGVKGFLGLALEDLFLKLCFFISLI